LYGQGDAGKKILKVLLSKDISIHKVLNYLE